MKQLSFEYNGVAYNFNSLHSMSDVDLEIRESFERVNKRAPSEKEIADVYDILVGMLTGNEGCLVYNKETNDE